MFRRFERYYAFSRRELIGIGALGVSLLVIGVFPMTSRLLPKSDPADMPKHVAEIERFLASAAVVGSLSFDQSGPDPDAVGVQPLTVEYFPFDPNGLAVVDWKRLGLSDRQARMIKNYEAKGGRFRKKEDLKKIYAIEDADYRRLEPYIRIKAPNEKSADPLPSFVDARDNGGSATMLSLAVAPIMLELNAVDSFQLQSLPGIGPSFASRIVRFRDRLGGFHDVGQLMDVYGFDSLRFSGLRNQVYVDSNGVTKIGLNTAGVEQLRTHPFISPKLANIIVQYRKQHGPYRSLDDLLQIAIMDDGIFRKIAPYLTIADD